MGRSQEGNDEGLKKKKKERTQVKILEWLDTVTKYAKKNETWTHSQVICGLVGNERAEEKQGLGCEVN